MTINMSPAEKKKATDDAMSWLRNNDPNWTTLTLVTPRRWRNLAGVKMPGMTRSEGKGEPRYG
jgi:hypothetical protein